VFDRDLWRHMLAAFPRPSWNPRPDVKDILADTTEHGKLASSSNTKDFSLGFHVASGRTSERAVPEIVEAFKRFKVSMTGQRSRRPWRRVPDGPGPARNP